MKTFSETYSPSEEILEKYADVMVRFALGDGKGAEPGDVVWVVCNEQAKPFLLPLQTAILKAGAHMELQYIPTGTTRNFYDIANSDQLKFVNQELIKSRFRTAKHRLVVLPIVPHGEEEGVEPAKLFAKDENFRPIIEVREELERAKKFFWSLCLYGTEDMAERAGMSAEKYWDQIIKACYLNEDDPVARWKDTDRQIKEICKKLNELQIEKVHIEGDDADLWITIGEKRKWIGGGGYNIPSFEIFTSPDWRGTNGWIKFNQPLYLYGPEISDIELTFKDGVVTDYSAATNQQILDEVFTKPNANKVGEFSLTDASFSDIDQIMKETLFDENIGGAQGNTHIAIGAAYDICYDGDVSQMKKEELQAIGFNKECTVHADIISTTRRTVTATTYDGKTIKIYEDGHFKLG